MERQARESGICPVREELFSQCFDEIIRQVTLNEPERGLLLLRVRDEIKMTIAAYQTLYQSSVTFAMRKQLQAEHGKADLERKIEELQKKADKFAKEDLSEDGAIATLTDKHFQHDEALLFKKRGFLNESFWWIRQIFYFVVLAGIAFLLRGWSLKQDRDGDPKWFRWMRRWSCGLLLFFATAWTFLVFDWLMGLDYSWFSTMWGVYLFAGAALNSMGFLVILLTLLRRAGYLKNVVTMEHYHLMGKLMHAFVIFWAYIAFSQFFLIWYANITEETKFFLTRNTGFWNTYTIAFLVIGHFFVPFVALLLRAVKKIPHILSGIAAWNLLMHAFDL